jgi:hypothetical protein
MNDCEDTRAIYGRFSMTSVEPILHGVRLLESRDARRGAELMDSALINIGRDAQPKDALQELVVSLAPRQEPLSHETPPQSEADIPTVKRFTFRPVFSFTPR